MYTAVGICMDISRHTVIKTLILPNISLTSDFCQSVISCYINISFYTFVFKIVLERVTEFSRSTAYFMRFYFA